MSTLLIQKLETELAQELRYNLSDRCQIGAFIPYIYMHNAPSGTFTIDLLNSDDDVIMSKQFDCDDIKTALSSTDNYAHVFYPIIPTSPIQIEYGTYTIKLSASGYSPTNASYLGWIQQHENIQNIMDYVPSDDTKNSLALRIKKWRQ